MLAVCKVAVVNHPFVSAAAKEAKEATAVGASSDHSLARQPRNLRRRLLSRQERCILRRRRRRDKWKWGNVRLCCHRRPFCGSFFFFRTQPPRDVNSMFLERTRQFQRLRTTAGLKVRQVGFAKC